VKVFISYATEDESTAGSLDDDLHAAGATTFLFGRSETSGETSWDEVLTWIEDSDAFVALISASALLSTPVLEEINHAHYSYINSNRSKPSKLIPAILEAGAEPPIAIKRFTRLDLTDYRSGLERLLSDLDLKKSVLAGLTPPERRESQPAIDFEELFGRAEPPSALPARKWSEDATKMLFNYEKHKPDEIGEAEEVDHIDSLLGKYSGKPVSAFGDPDSLEKADATFLGVEPSSAPDLSDVLLRPSLTKRIALEAPTLENVLGVSLSWNEVLGATGYVLESSDDAGFMLPSEIDAGTDTSYLPGLGVHGYFRVKAKGGVLFDDSPWSNHVEIKAPKIPGYGALSAPSLTARHMASMVSLDWSEVEGASGYVLERSSGIPLLLAGTVDSLREPTYDVIYEGADTTYLDPGPENPAAFTLRRYRVKAKGGFLQGDSPWSEPVEPED
jgi:TIR domain